MDTNLKYFPSTNHLSFSILLYAVRWNTVQERSMSKRSSLDAWRQMTEVLLCSVPQDILPNSAKQQLLLDTLQTLLNKV